MPPASAPDDAAEQLYRRGLQALAERDMALAEALLKQLLAQRPEHAGAWMDLAVLYCHLGDEANARALWDEVETRFAPPPAIRELIALQRAQGCVAPASSAASVLEGHWSRGRSSNVNQGVRDLNIGLGGPEGTLYLTLLPEYAPRADGYTQGQLAWRQPLGRAAGLEGFVQWQGRRHDRQRAFDVHDLSLGLAQQGAASGWRWQWQAATSQLWLGEQPYQRAWRAQASVSPAWQPAPAWRWHLQGAASHLAYPTLPGFGARLWEGQLQAAHTGEHSRTRLQAGLALDDGGAQRPGGDRDGWNLGAQWRHTLGAVAGATLGLEAGWSLQRWQGRRAYAPGLIDQPRVQKAQTAWAALSWPTGPDSAWVLEARKVRNDENIGLFAYDTVTLQLGWQHRWRPQRLR